jgi:hypothetical protein
MDWIVAESQQNFVQKSKLLFNNSFTILELKKKEIFSKMFTTDYATKISKIHVAFEVQLHNHLIILTESNFFKMASQQPFFKQNVLGKISRNKKK